MIMMVLMTYMLTILLILQLIILQVLLKDLKIISKNAFRNHKKKKELYKELENFLIKSYI